MGFSVAVIKGEKIIYQNAFGLQDYEMNKALTTDSIFRIASISKTFTSTSIMILFDRGEEFQYIIYIKAQLTWIEIFQSI